MSKADIRDVDIIAPNFKKRLSGVTATIVRLVPLQAKSIKIAATGPILPDHVPQVPLSSLLTMPQLGPSGARVWHARRNVEMLGGLALKYLLGKKLRLLFTSASQRRHTGYSKWLISKMDAVIATSRKTAAYLDRDATVIHHGIDTEVFRPADDKADLRRDLGLPDTGILIGCYGRIRAQKGTDVFVDAMMALAADHPEMTAIVMGRATEKHQGFERDLKERVEKAGLADRIRFLPEVPVWEIAKYYQVLDLYIAPQRWEGFGLTPLEAMACAVPVVATTVGAFEELIVEGQTGVLIPPGDVAAMETASGELINDRARLSGMSDNALAHVQTNFTLDREATALNAVYRSLLDH